MNKNLFFLVAIVVFTLLPKSWAQEVSQVSALRVATHYIKEGDTIGQCKITSMPTLTPVVRLGTKTYATLVLSVTSLTTKEVINLTLLSAEIMNIDSGEISVAKNGSELRKLGPWAQIIVDKKDKIQSLNFMGLEKTAPHFTLPCL